MARDIPCDVCAVMVAERLIGNLTNGEQTALCAGCQVVWMLAQLEELLNDDAKRLVAERWAPAPAATATTVEPTPVTPAEAREQLLAMGAPETVVEQLTDDQTVALLAEARARTEGADQDAPKRRPGRRRRPEPAGDDSGPAEAPPAAPEAAAEAAAVEPDQRVAEAPSAADDE